MHGNKGVERAEDLSMAPCQLLATQDHVLAVSASSGSGGAASPSRGSSGPYKIEGWRTVLFLSSQAVAQRDGLRGPFPHGTEMMLSDLFCEVMHSEG